MVCAVAMLAELITRDAVEVEPGILSTIPAAERAAAYDSLAGFYDKVIASATYNRLIWGNTLDRYDEFGRRALAGARGPVLDAGCGSLVFTAKLYAQCPAPILLLDRSLGMLRRARPRIGGDHPRLLLQGDVYDLPLAGASFGRVFSFAISHVLADRVAMYRELRRVIRPDGKLFLTSLVTGPMIGNLWGKLLHAQGQLAEPYAPEQLIGELEAAGFAAQVQVHGSVAYYVAQPA